MYNADLTTRITNFFYEETFTEGFISVLYNQGYLIVAKGESSEIVEKFYPDGESYRINLI